MVHLFHMIMLYNQYYYSHWSDTWNVFPFSVHSFKMKLLISLLTIGLLPLVSISVFYQHFLDVRITKDIESASIDRLRYTSYDIRRQMEISTSSLDGSLITESCRKYSLLTTLKNTKSSWISSSLVLMPRNMQSMQILKTVFFKILIVENNGESFQMEMSSLLWIRMRSKRPNGRNL